MASLDGLRALAIAGVYGLHLQGQAFPGGAVGVDLFFVLSAYLITSLLLAERRDTGRIGLRAFYWRRVFRLGPALVVWLAVLAAPTAALQGGTEAIGWGTAAVLSYSTNFLEAWSSHIVPAYNQGWSLAIEEQFYLLWPLALIWLTSSAGTRLRNVAVAALVTGSATLLLFAPNYFLPTAHLFALALGCGLRSSQQPERPACSGRCSATPARVPRPSASCSRSSCSRRSAGRRSSSPETSRPSP